MAEGKSSLEVYFHMLLTVKNRLELTNKFEENAFDMLHLDMKK